MESHGVIRNWGAELISRNSQEQALKRDKDFGEIQPKI